MPPLIRWAMARLAMNAQGMARIVPRGMTPQTPLGEQRSMCRIVQVIGLLL
jgi:hypothetical protein